MKYCEENSIDIKEPADKDIQDADSYIIIKICIFLDIIMFFLICFFLRFSYSEVTTGCMEPVFNIGDYILFDKQAYKHKEPERYDIILFEKDLGTEFSLHGKRIIGMPGELLEIRKGKVYINNDKYPLRDPYADYPRQEYLGPFRIPEDSYFVMGDNRQESYDSRHWEDKYVKRKEIRSKAVLKIFPEIQAF